MIGELTKVLSEVEDRSGADFAELGIIVYESLLDLPVFPLRDSIPIFRSNRLPQKLIDLSKVSSDYHDGFHLISKDWALTHVSQYFSPPIVSTLKVDRKKRFGGRYMAALFGSRLPCILLTGIISVEYGIAIFDDGKEIRYEK